jgi:hypothetical protein
MQFGGTPLMPRYWMSMRYLLVTKSESSGPCCIPKTFALSPGPFALSPATSIENSPLETVCGRTYRTYPTNGPGFN